MVKVELYTNKGCAACVNAKRLFDQKGVVYEEKKLGASARMDREFLLRTEGSKSVPQIFIGEKWIGGFDDVLRYDRANELDWLLGLEDRPKVSVLAKLIRMMRGQTF